MAIDINSDSPEQQAQILNALGALGNTIDALQAVIDAAKNGDATAKAKLATLQATLIGASSQAVSASRALVAADRGVLLVSTNNPAFTVNTGMPDGWHVPIEGACTFTAGASVTLNDRREPGATYPFCVITLGPVAGVYYITGSK